MEQIIQSLLKNKGRTSLITTLIVAVLVLGGSFYRIFSSDVQATALTQVKDTLSTSAPAPTKSNHTIQFILQHRIDESDSIRIGFTSSSPGWTITALDVNDIDLATSSAGTCSAIQTNTGDENLTSAFGTGPLGTKFSVNVVSSSNMLVFTATSSAQTIIATSSCVVIRVGTNAIFQASGTGQITNPTKVAGTGIADIPSVTIAFTGTAAADTGTALAATVEGVTVSITIDASLSFTIGAVASGSCTTGGSATAITTTSSTVPFGSSGITTNTFYKGCQTLTVSTNASSGYAITQQENTSLQSGASLITDTNCDASTCSAPVASAATWATATNNGFGFTCTGSSCDSNFTSGTKFTRFACTGAAANCTPSSSLSAITFITTSTPVSSDISTVTYKISVSGTQAAGSYSNTITYITTPTF